MSESHDIKTGQHIDSQKRNVVLPHLTELILRNSPSEDTALAVLDIGTGDGSFLSELLLQLSKQEKHTTRVNMIDLEVSVMPALIKMGLAFTKRDGNAAIIQPFIASDVGPELEQYERQFDIGLSTLTLHQIENPALVKLYFCRLFMALKDEHFCYLTDLHPKYLNYLSKQHPNKFHYETKQRGIYSFDSGGDSTIYIHSLADQLSWARSVGFELNSFTIPSIAPIAESKKRYQQMMHEGIPLFYTLALRKDSQRSFDYTEGVLEKITREDNRIALTFIDNEEVSFPWPSTKEIPARPSDYIIFIATRNPEDKTQVLFNLWVAPEDNPDLTRHYELGFRIIN